GIGSHVLSSELPKISSDKYEGLKSYFIVGRALLGAIYVGCIIYLPALWFWTLTDGDFTKITTLQLFIFPILLIEQITYLLLATTFHLPWYSSPFSLGVFAQYITTKKFIIYFLASFSIFKVWAIAIQYFGLVRLTTRSRFQTFAIVLSIHIILWVITASLTYFNFNILL